jgi:hypothetical protein
LFVERRRVNGSGLAQNLLQLTEVLARSSHRIVTTFPVL